MSQANVVLVDYGVGNLLSVSRALEAAGGNVIRTGDPVTIKAAPRLVVPGVGAFGACVERLRQLSLWEPLQTYLDCGRPFLGICVGMQMLMETSEEFGEHEGFGVIPGRVVAIPNVTADGRPHKIPNVGWRALANPPRRADWGGTMLADTREGEDMYFVHSFAAMPSDDSFRLADCDYNGRTICAALQKGTVFGCQFHPEKSGLAGQTILKSFLAL